MSYALFIFLNIILIQLSISDPCKYYESPSNHKDTDEQYLSSTNEEDEKKQKCFSLSDSDINTGLCCYNSQDKLCEQAERSSGNVYCPVNSEIHNNCGMARFYQPESKEACTEISLVNGYCCFVKTKAASNQGNACLKQDEIDEDEKDEITDYMKDYFRNRLGLNPDEVIDTVQCEGSLLKYYGFLMILLSVICL